MATRDYTQLRPQFTLHNTSITPNHPTELDTDAMHCALERAAAIVDLLLQQGEHNEFAVGHATVIHSLWAVDGFLEQMAALLDGASQTGCQPTAVQNKPNGGDYKTTAVKTGRQSAGNG